MSEPHSRSAAAASRRAAPRPPPLLRLARLAPPLACIVAVAALGLLGAALGLVSLGAGNWLAAALGVVVAGLAGLAAWALRDGAASAAELERARAEAAAAVRAAAEAQSAKARFLAAAGHDMRQPLHAITLYISALKRRVAGGEAEDILVKLDRAAHSLTGMFAALLDLARVQAGGAHLEMARFRLRDSLAAVAAEHPGAALVPAADADVQVLSDRGLLERLAHQLVANAVTHGGGAAEISYGVAADGRAFFAVADHGPGIAAEDQERIFEEFVRLSARSGADGLGLGLAMARRIAGLIGAEVRVASAPGAGARFTVTLPRAAPAPADAPADDALAGLRIAAIDDEPPVLEAIAQTLRDAGAEVREGDGEAALRAIIAEGWAPHAIVTDFRLGGELRGADAARSASAGLDPAPAILVVTGDTGPDTEDALRRSGLPWLVKPVEPEDLTRTLRGLIASAT